MSGPAGRRRVVDGRGVELALPDAPRRVVSLVPSATETLHAFGCADRVVGITRFCCSPRPWVDGVTKVGGTKDVDIDAVKRLAPDLVVGNCEENTREIFEAIDAFAPVYAPFPRSLDRAIADLADLGTLLGIEAVGESWRRRVVAARAALRPEPFRYAYLIWRKPWMTVSDDTFIAAMLREVGGVNALDDPDDRFPTVDASRLRSCGADVVLLSSEPMRFLPRHADELAEQCGLPRDRIRFVDGAHCSWHGSRMARALAYLGRCRAEGFPQAPEPAEPEEAAGAAGGEAC